MSRVGQNRAIVRQFAKACTIANTAEQLVHDGRKRRGHILTAIRRKQRVELCEVWMGEMWESLLSAGQLHEMAEHLVEIAQYLRQFGLSRGPASEM